MTTMTVSRVLLLLASWADDADGKALSAPDAVSVVQAHQRAERYRAMVTAIREAIATGHAPVVVPKRRAKVSIAKMDAPAFWQTHGEAVQAIIAVYGLNWKIAAPYGQTELAEIPSKWCSWKGPRGSRITWPSDARIPAAAYWPDGVIP